MEYFRTHRRSDHVTSKYFRAIQIIALQLSISPAVLASNSTHGDEEGDGNLKVLRAARLIRGPGGILFACGAVASICACCWCALRNKNNTKITQTESEEL